MEYDPFDSEENEEREEAMEPRRMEVYSDAVFSIIATISKASLLFFVSSVRFH